MIDSKSKHQLADDCKADAGNVHDFISRKVTKKGILRYTKVGFFISFVTLPPRTRGRASQQHRRGGLFPKEPRLERVVEPLEE